MNIEQMLSDVDVWGFVHNNYHAILWGLGFIGGMRAAVAFYRSMVYAGKRSRI